MAGILNQRNPKPNSGLDVARSNQSKSRELGSSRLVRNLVTDQTGRRGLRTIAWATLTLATLATALGLTELALTLDAGLLVVATTLDLAKHPFAGHQPAELSDRTLDAALVDANLEGTTEHGHVLLGGVARRSGGLRFGLGHEGREV
jgi:hypothetical protein